GDDLCNNSSSISPAPKTSRRPAPQDTAQDSAGRGCVTTPTSVAAAQSVGAPPALLSVTNSAGPGPDAGGAVGPKLRLFVSPVKPPTFGPATHTGGAVPP